MQFIPVGLPEDRKGVIKSPQLILLLQNGVCIINLKVPHFWLILFFNFQLAIAMAMPMIAIMTQRFTAARPAKRVMANLKEEVYASTVR